MIWNGHLLGGFRLLRFGGDADDLCSGGPGLVGDSNGRKPWSHHVFRLGLILEVWACGFPMWLLWWCPLGYVFVGPVMIWLKNYGKLPTGRSGAGAQKLLWNKQESSNPPAKVDKNSGAKKTARIDKHFFHNLLFPKRSFDSMSIQTLSNIDPRLFSALSNSQIHVTPRTTNG